MPILKALPQQGNVAFNISPPTGKPDHAVISALKSLVTQGGSCHKAIAIKQVQSNPIGGIAAKSILPK